MSSTFSEKSVEEHLKDRVREAGGFCIKLRPEGYKGIPDRLVVLPDRIIFVELKRPRGGVTAKLQQWWIARLRRLGAEALVVSTREEVDDLVR